MIQQEKHFPSKYNKLWCCGNKGQTTLSLCLHVRIFFLAYRYFSFWLHSKNKNYVKWIHAQKMK